MGQLLRRFWHPVGVSEALKPGEAVPVRIFGDDLTLYRGESGAPYLVAGRCAHRCTVLHTGWVQGEDIRCIYHGWKYDGTGQCTEAPAEVDGFADRIRIDGYPARDYGGLVFAYLGEGDGADAFELMRKAIIDAPGSLTLTKPQLWPCNWFQMIENSMDSVHVSFVHRAGKVGPLGSAVSRTLPKLDYFETEAGIRQIATRGENNVRISDWTFPNGNHIVVPGPDRSFWIDNYTWRVAVDDSHTMRYSIYVVPKNLRDSYDSLKEYFDRYADYNPADHHDALFFDRAYPEEPFIQLTSAQDYVAMRGQGVTVDRTREHLGGSDRGIALMRRIFNRELDAFAAGTPKQWRRLAQELDLHHDDRHV